jgi:hypothetical protein
MFKLHEKPTVLKKNIQPLRKIKINIFFFVVYFCPPGSGSGSRDLIESGSNPDTNPQHWLKLYKVNILSLKATL